MPVARTAFAVAAPMSRISFGLRAAPSPILCGNSVAPGTLLWPWTASVPHTTGTLIAMSVFIDASWYACASASHSFALAALFPFGQLPPPLSTEPR